MKLRHAMITGLLLAAVCLAASGCFANSGSTAANQTTTVEKGNISINITASGNLVTSKEANLAFYSSGTVKEVLVEVGDMVKEGQALASLEIEPLQSNLEQMQINVKQAEMNLENAIAGSSAPDPLNIEIKELQLKNAKSNLDEAQRKLDRATITASFAGLITAVNVVAGDQVTNSTVAVRLIDPYNFKTDVLVNEMEIFRLKIGTPATVKVVALSSNSYPARVSLISETATVQSNVVNYKVTVEMSAGDTMTANQTRAAAPFPISDNITRRFPASDNMSRPFPSSDNASGRTRFAGRSAMQSSGQAASAAQQNVRLKEGLTVTVSITVDESTNVLLVPNRAITSRGGKYYAQVLTAAGVPEERVIQVGITDGENTEVVSGLSEGEKVAILSTATTTGTTTRTSTTQQRSSMGGMPGVFIPR
ncbi:MAG: efflux RND transporter periplasmic adaptor subunit [Dehalococcoidia bacterium]|nr:efflux RND transporter periplasmic adaptor subunit [Dehalococcoidia bacterium]MDD5494954.1 efflux RND transporter periplasmic adaptor subunit [Dehalococcoidia bacterium]